jgi:hypothetical protein
MRSKAQYLAFRLISWPFSSPGFDELLLNEPLLHY